MASAHLAELGESEPWTRRRCGSFGGAGLRSPISSLRHMGLERRSLHKRLGQLHKHITWRLLTCVGSTADSCVDTRGNEPIERVNEEKKHVSGNPGLHELRRRFSPEAAGGSACRAHKAASRFGGCNVGSER